MQDLQRILESEKQRQQQTLSLIASENYVSKVVLEASASVFTNKYAEGYPGKRYYAGNEFSDELETLTQELAQEVFATDYHVNVQPHSGSDANLAVYGALLKPGDTVLALSLAHGGHLTHGHSVSYTGQVYNFVHYTVKQDTELIDYDEVAALAKEHKPKLIVCGGSAYPMHVDFAKFAKIAQAHQAWLMVDMAHFAGLVAGKVYPTPFGHADVVTTTTQKTLRGPRGGMIFARKEFAKAVDRAVFPGLQGGPHMHTIAAKAASLYEALQPQFRDYAKQVITNTQALAYALQQRGFRLVGNGTDTHLFLMDLRGTGMSGKDAQTALEAVGITCNMNALPYDPNPPTNPSGLRIGTAALTTRGMKERDMELLADCITAVLTTPEHSAVAQTVAQIARKFRIPGL
ncbi:serine hydroxymethyltransferase [soil metagenome]